MTDEHAASFRPTDRIYMMSKTATNVTNVTFQLVSLITVLVRVSRLITRIDASEELQKVRYRRYPAYLTNIFYLFQKLILVAETEDLSCLNMLDKACQAVPWMEGIFVD